MITLAAGCFVGAFTIAALAPPGLSLGDALQRVVGHSLSWLDRIGPSWIGPSWIGPSWIGFGWHEMVLPFLLRPAWLPPVMLGFVSAGVAITLGRTLPGKAR